MSSLAGIDWTERWRREAARRHDIKRLEYLYRFAMRWYERYWTTQLESLSLANPYRVGYAEGHSYFAENGGWGMDHTQGPDNELGVLVRGRFRVLRDHGTRIRKMHDALDAALRSLIYKDVDEWTPHTTRLVCVTVNGRPYWYQGSLDSSRISRAVKVAWSDDEPWMMEVA